MKEKIQKVFRQNIPFVVVFVAALIWHLVIKISAGDDVVYFQTLMDGRSIWEILAHRYATWSSRMAIEFVLIPLVQVPWLWKILDIIVFTLIPVLLYRLLFLNPEKYLDMGASHVIVTSYVFRDGIIDYDRLENLSHLVVTVRLKNMMM